MIEDIAFDWMPSIIENFVILYFMSYYLGFKDHIALRYRRAILVIFTCLLCFLSNLSSYITTYEVVFTLLAIVVCICYGLIFLKGSFLSTVFTSLIPFVFIIVINTVVLYVFSVLTSTTMKTLIFERNAIRVLLLVITKGSFILAISLISRLSPKSDFMFKKNEIVAILSIFVSSLLISGFIFDKQIKLEVDGDNGSILYFISAVFGLIVINVLTFLSYLKIEKDNKEKIQYELVKLQLEQQKQSYEEFEKKNLEIRKIRHDMRNYMEACLALMQSGEHKSAQEYLYNICTNVIEPINYTIITNNSLINAVLNNKLHLCNNYGIKVKYSILSDFDEFDELDICVLLGNLWNNAIEATQDLVTEKEIEFEVLSKKNYIIIILRNSITESIMKKNPKFFTTKKDKLNHGLGIVSIRDIVDKYEGIMENSETDNKIEFQITLKRGLKEL
ncbi:MAG: GHKL domain-containing protein [Clostridiales bacterium]|nr:sensor histidine kinase [uncultured Anaerosporobacter sp.]MBS5934714.1 GHKL domain-containing protein [Clostridiales bacterium]